MISPTSLAERGHDQPDRRAPVMNSCLLGPFRVLKHGQQLPLRGGGKMNGLLSALALREHQQATRDALLETLWPEIESDRASQSLNTLVHASRRLLAERWPVFRHSCAPMTGTGSTSRPASTLTRFASTPAPRRACDGCEWVIARERWPRSRRQPESTGAISARVVTACPHADRT